jgi:Holliday junction resolvase RusA-like endonuclease
MTQSLTLVIPGTPVGKGRPRFAARGKYVHTYTPEKTANYEALVQMAWAMEGRVAIPQGVGIRAMIAASFPIPKSRSKKDRAAMAAGEIPYLAKPDADNLAKSCLDALNGCAYPDDSQIISLSVQKLYAVEPQCVIRLEWEAEDGE